MKSALVLSPFATAPLDAGHRRRVFQTTQMLKDQGYRVTFLFYAFEDAWLWRHQASAYDVMKGQWDEVIVFASDQKPGFPPQFGRDHQLDEWWNDGFGQFLDNLFSRRSFDLMVVHNVWLSKAFDHAPQSAVRVLETHDIFHRRRALLDSMGIGHDFFVPSEEGEIFGINRADIAVTIQEEEARYLLGRCTSHVITIPFFDQALEAQAREVRKAEYLHRDKVVFGFLGSRHIFNVSGLRALIQELERQIGETYAPVDIVCGGTAIDLIDTHLPVRRLGHIESEIDLYRMCDIAIAPTFAGTGFKIKVADCLALRMPLLCAAHSAIGTSLGGRCVMETPGQMAAAMVDISLRRPVLAAMRDRVTRASQDLRQKASLGMRNFDRVARRFKTAMVLDLRARSIQSDLMALYGAVSCLRDIAQRMPVYVLLQPAVGGAIRDVLPPGVSVLSPGAESTALLGQISKIVVDISGVGREALAVSRHDRYVPDTRWDFGAAEDAAFDRAAETLNLPHFHSNHSWEPAVERLKRAWRKQNVEIDSWLDGVDVLVFCDAAGAARLPQRIALQRRFLIVDVANTALFTAAVLYILERPLDRVEVFCTCRAPRIQAVLLAACQRSSQRFSATSDGVFKISFPQATVSPPPRVVAPVIKVEVPAAGAVEAQVPDEVVAPSAVTRKMPRVTRPFTRHVLLDKLVLLDGEAFVSACYQDILGKLTDRAGMQHYLYQLACGTTKESIVRHLLKDPEAVARNVELITADG